MPQTNASALYMSSPINALLEGLFEAPTSMAELKQHGNFGIGTFNDLDGELILIDGQIFRLAVDGAAHAVTDEVLTPFACACQFAPLSSENIAEPLLYKELETLYEQVLISPNAPHALRLDGYFKSVRTRSVPRTANYTPLADATDKQQLREFNDIHGTLVGFYCPPFIPSVNVPGFHFHFITDDRSAGGHLLHCDLQSGELSVQFFRRIDLALPITQDYLTADFQRDAQSDLEKAEKE